MPEESQENKIPKNIKRTRKWVWCAAIVIVIAAIICCLFWTVWKCKSVDEQLATIEAARAIPDKENATTIYNVLLQDANATSLLDTRPGFLDDDSDNLTFRQPWSGKDFPELAVWIKEKQHVIDRLLEASKFDKCRFPIATDQPYRPQRTHRLSATRKWVFLLRRAANNDIGEGRINDAIDKWRCLLQMGNHLCQQPIMVDYLVGIAVEAIALGGMKTFILEGDATEAHLKTIEAIPLQTKNNWDKDSSMILEVERLYERKHLGLFDRLKFAWQGIRVEDSLERIHEQCLRLLANHRGNRILIALRRYKNKHDRWPESLDDIKLVAPAEILVDPINGGSFVYKLTEENFTLYSKGKNNIDEDGIRSVTFDPNDFKWPKTEEDDWLIWPPRNRKTQEENTDAEQQ